MTEAYLALSSPDPESPGIDMDKISWIIANATVSEAQGRLSKNGEIEGGNVEIDGHPF